MSSPTRPLRLPPPTRQTAVRRRPWGRRPVRTIGLVVLLLPVLLVGITAARVAQVAGTDDRGPADAIVVLGAAQYDGRPSAVLAARLDHAVDLFEDDVAPRILTVGSNQPGDRFTEARSAKSYLVEAGVPELAVLPVESGTDTYDSLVAVDRVFGERGWDSAVIVSDPGHSLRSRRIARDVGMDAVTSPTRTGPQGDLHAAYLARETAAYLVYRLRSLV